MKHLVLSELHVTMEHLVFIQPLVQKERHQGGNNMKCLRNVAILISVPFFVLKSESISQYLKPMG